MPEVYKIGVEILLAGTIAQGLEAVAQKLLGINTKISDIEGGFKAWLPAIAAVAGAFAAAKIVEELVKIEQAGEKVVHQLELMKIAGNSDEIAENLKTAYAVSAAVKTTSPSENLAHIAELTYAIGNADEARKLLPAVAKAQQTLESLNPAAHDQVWSLVKSLEEKGVDPESFSDYLDMMTQAGIASRGRVTPQGFFSAFKYGRAAKYGWDKDFIGGYLPRLIQEYGSAGGGSGGGGQGGPGNALMSAFSAVVGGRMTGKAVNAFNDLGLVADPSKLIRNTAGKITGIKAGGMAGNDLMVRNPYEWVQQILVPALVKANHGKIPGQEELITKLNELFGNRTAADIITNMALQGRAIKGDESYFEKDKRQNLRAMKNAQAAAELSANDPPTIRKAFWAQWEAMLEALGTPMVAPAMESMKKVTEAFTAIAQSGGAHPEVIKATGEAIVLFMATMINPALLGPVAQLIGLTDGMKRVGEGLGSLAGGISNFMGRIGRFLGIGAASALPHFTTDDIKALGGKGLGGGLLNQPAGGEPMGGWFHRRSSALIPPPNNQTPIVLTANMTVDSTPVARIVESRIAEMHELADAASAPNRVAYLGLGDSDPVVNLG